MSGYARVTTDEIDAAMPALQPQPTNDAPASQLPEMSGYTRVTTDQIDAAMSAGRATDQAEAPVPASRLPEMSGYTRVSTDEIAVASLTLQVRNIKLRPLHRQKCGVSSF